MYISDICFSMELAIFHLTERAFFWYKYACRMFFKTPPPPPSSKVKWSSPLFQLLTPLSLTLKGYPLTII